VFELPERELLQESSVSCERLIWRSNEDAELNCYISVDQYNGDRSEEEFVAEEM
jgi:hypothetical protein